MARTILDDVDRVLASKWYRAWAVVHAADARKIELEREGYVRPQSDDAWARTFIVSIRAGRIEAKAPSPSPPPTPEPPPASAIPSPFNGRGLVLLEPTGGTEDIQAAKSAGFTYLLLNIAYVNGGGWELQLHRAAQLGLQVVPWRRIYNAEHARHVERTASAWGSLAAAHNLEAEAATTFPPANLASVCREFPASRMRAVITEPWMQLIDWSPLRTWTAIPESFLNADARYLPADLVRHANDMGVPRALPMFGWGEWDDAPHFVPPSVYLDRWPVGPFAVYPGDGKESLYSQWRR